MTRPLYRLAIGDTPYTVLLAKAKTHDRIFLPLFTSTEYAGLYAAREAKPTRIVLLDTWWDILDFVEHPPLPGESPLEIESVVIDQIDGKHNGLFLERKSFIEQLRQNLEPHKPS